MENVIVRPGSKHLATAKHMDIRDIDPVIIINTWISEISTQ
jgi:hypothetical protein